MLATLVDAPFNRANWIYEEKYDGIRILAYKESSHVSLISRNAINRTDRYPEIAQAVQKLNADTLLLDGELVIFDEKRVSRFQLLQRGKGKPAYAVFDCLYCDGKDLRRRPLAERRRVLEAQIHLTGRLQTSCKLADDGLKAFRVASQRGLEGVVAKNLASVYESRRSHEWLKFKVHQEQEFVIGGFTKPKGSRTDFGALLLGVYDNHQALRYVGKVGTGFDSATLGALYRKFQPLIRAKSPFADSVREGDVTFLKPTLVAQIAFTEWTNDGRLRHPVYLGLRDDKKATDVHREG
jgi:bifunctional non-homologous end joining protein LigD